MRNNPVIIRNYHAIVPRCELFNIGCISDVITKHRISKMKYYSITEYKGHRIEFLASIFKNLKAACEILQNIKKINYCRKIAVYAPRS